jgi:hypothetical protein
MIRPLLYPLHEEAERLLRHAKLTPHVGRVTLSSHGTFSGRGLLPGARYADWAGSFLVPASGQALFFLHSQSKDTLARNYGEGLSMEGLGDDGPFKLICPQYYVDSSSWRQDGLGWAIASPRNRTVEIHYGDHRPTKTVEAIINNFDYEYGNSNALGSSRGADLLVKAGGRPVTFSWRKHHDHLRRLVDVEVLRSTALVGFSFVAAENESEDHLVAFAHSVAWLCSIVAQQHTGIPVLTFRDTDGHVIKRRVGNPVESRFRRGLAVDAMMQLPKLFAECFETHNRMFQSERWQRMPSFIAAMEDPPYLEEKLANVLAAVELLIRNCLVDEGLLSQEQAEDKTLSDLIGLAKRKLGWDLPKHYTAKQRHLELRNAVAHGKALPNDIARVRYYFDKWRLFLLRRYLIILGFTGQVESPFNGFASSSGVGNFEAEHNTFDP